MKVQIDDSILVKHYIAGDEKALETLIQKHNQRIFGFIFSKVLNKDIAEDIFQDTFIKVIKTLKRGAYSEKGKFLPWVMRIAHNLIVDYFRKNKRMPRFEGVDNFNIFSVLADENLDAEEQLIKNQTDSDLALLIEELPKDQKEVLVMRMYKNMSFKEISEHTGISINTALGRMRYALINLRKIVNQRNIALTD